MRNVLISALLLSSPMAFSQATSKSIVDQGGDTVKLLSAEVTSTYINGTGTASKDATSIDFANCDALEPINKKFSRFDCSAELTALTGYPVAKKMFIDDAGALGGSFVSPTSFCSVVSLDVVVRQSAEANLEGIGFYIDYQQTLVEKADLVEVSRVTLADDEVGVVYRFSMAHRCTQKMTKAKVKWYAEFKPYIIVNDETDATVSYRIWDDAIDNYKMFEEISTIDQSEDLLK